MADANANLAGIETRQGHVKVTPGVTNSQRPNGMRIYEFEGRDGIVAV
jgi:hypothetical protein